MRKIILCSLLAAMFTFCTACNVTITDTNGNEITNVNVGETTTDDELEPTEQMKNHEGVYKLDFVDLDSKKIYLPECFEKVPGTYFQVHSGSLNTSDKIYYWLTHEWFYTDIHDPSTYDVNDVENIMQEKFEKMMTEVFPVVAEKPKLGFCTTLAAGFTNMIFDFLLVAVFPFGIVGAAMATVASQFAGGIIPLIYFARKNTSLLKLGKAEFDVKALRKTCTNGSSEFVSGVSMSLVSMLYNMQLLKYSGEDGVAAYGVLMYVNFLFLAVFIGYSVGTAPIVSFNFGAKNVTELKNVFYKSLKILAIVAVVMFCTSEILARPLAAVFVGYDAGLTGLTVSGFRIFSFSFLLAGVPIYGSSFFTALNDGFVSAAISFLRTVVFETVSVLVLPLFFGINGVWFSLVAAEFVAALVTVSFYAAKRKKYGY